MRDSMLLGFLFLFAWFVDHALSKDQFGGGAIIEHPKACAWLQCERGNHCVNRKFWCKNPPCPSMLYCSKTRREFYKGPTTCDSVRCTKGYICLVKVRRCQWNQGCEQRIARCVSAREYYEGPASCADSNCPPRYRCILREALCAKPPCRLIKTCAKVRDVNVWHSRCKRLGCPSEYECFLRRPPDNCPPMETCKHTPDCTTTNGEKNLPSSKLCRGWVCPRGQECSAKACESGIDVENCKVDRTCRETIAIHGSSLPPSFEKLASLPPTVAPHNGIIVSGGNASKVRKTLTEMEKDLILGDQGYRRRQTTSATSIPPTIATPVDPRDTNFCHEKHGQNSVADDYPESRILSPGNLTRNLPEVPRNSTTPYPACFYQNTNVRGNSSWNVLREEWIQQGNVIFKSPIYVRVPDNEKVAKIEEHQRYYKTSGRPMDDWLDYLRIKTGIDAINAWTKYAEANENYEHFEEWLESVKNVLGTSRYGAWLEKLRDVTSGNAAFQEWLSRNNEKLMIIEQIRGKDVPILKNDTFIGFESQNHTRDTELMEITTQGLRDDSDANLVSNKNPMKNAFQKNDTREDEDQPPSSKSADHEIVTPLLSRPKTIPQNFRPPYRGVVYHTRDQDTAIPTKKISHADLENIKHLVDSDVPNNDTSENLDESFHKNPTFNRSIGYFPANLKENQSQLDDKTDWKLRNAFVQTNTDIESTDEKSRTDKEASNKNDTSKIRSQLDDTSEVYQPEKTEDSHVNDLSHASVKNVSTQVGNLSMEDHKKLNETGINILSDKESVSPIPKIEHTNNSTKANPLIPPLRENNETTVSEMELSNVKPHKRTYFALLRFPMGRGDSRVRMIGYPLIIPDAMKLLPGDGWAQKPQVDLTDIVLPRQKPSLDEPRGRISNSSEAKSKLPSAYCVHLNQISSKKPTEMPGNSEETTTISLPGARNVEQKSKEPSERNKTHSHARQRDYERFWRPRLWRPTPFDRHRKKPRGSSTILRSSVIDFPKKSTVPPADRGTLIYGESNSASNPKDHVSWYEDKSHDAWVSDNSSTKKVTTDDQMKLSDSKLSEHENDFKQPEPETNDDYYDDIERDDRSDGHSHSTSQMESEEFPKGLQGLDKREILHYDQSLALDLFPDERGYQLYDYEDIFDDGVFFKTAENDSVVTTDSASLVNAQLEEYDVVDNEENIGKTKELSKHEDDQPRFATTIEDYDLQYYDDSE